MAFPKPGSDPSAGTNRLLFSFAAGALATAIFLSIDHVATDNAEHAETAVKIWNGEADWPPNFLFFAVLGVFGKIIGDSETLIFSSCVLLGFAVAAKSFLTGHLVDFLAPNARLRSTVSVAALLLFIFPLPITFMLGSTLSFYLGTFPPNVWHNSTTIFLMPLALAAFFLQARNLEDGRSRNVTAIAVLIILGILIKPSFYFAYAPATALWLVARRRPFGALLRDGSPILAGAIVTGILYLAIYHLQQGSLHEEASGIDVKPFSVWSTFVPRKEIPLAFLASFLAPILYFVLALRPERPMWLTYALLLNAVSILLFIFVSETGPRQTHGNFFWQTVVCSYLLHAVLAADLLDKWTKGIATGRVLSCAAIYIAMFVSGAVYLYRLIFLGVFLPY